MKNILPALIFLLVIVVCVVGFAITPTKILYDVTRLLNQARTHSISPIITQTESVGKTYTDEGHGFSFQYPGRWGKITTSDARFWDSFPVSVTPINVENCTTADEYFKKEISPYYHDIQTAPISNPDLDGFVVQERHLDLVTPGPEAYIINCPYVIRLGFDPTGFDDGEMLFEYIISSFKTWKPSN